MAQIWVEDEFSQLHTVVLAQSEISIPDGAHDNPDIEFLPDRDESLMFTGDLRDANPERQQAWEAERESFADGLRKHWVRVVRPRMLTEAETLASAGHGYSNFFARDPFFTVGDHVIEGSLRFLHRRGEVLPMREVFRNEVYPTDARYVATPPPEVAAPDDPTLGAGPFIEGGDVLVLGRHVLVGSSGLASNEAGYTWLRRYLEPSGYTVELVKLHEKILHLDCALGLIRDGLMIVAPEAFVSEVPQVLNGWNRIEASFEDATRLATNGLALSPEVYVTDPDFEHLGSQVEGHGVKVEYVDFSITRSFGGSFRCSTQPLLRR